MADLSHLSRMLIVEDEALILLDLQSTLEDAGVSEVVTAVSLDEALALIEQHSFDAAVLDLHLNRSGWSYAAAQQLEAKGVPFVFSSGTVDVADSRFGHVPLVSKPFAPDELVGALRKVTAGAV